MQTSDLRSFAIGSTRHIVDMHEALDRCNAQILGIRAWCKAMSTEEAQ